MQYLLTDEEYRKLLNENLEYDKKMKQTLQDLCTEVAVYKPIKFWGRKEAEPWGCIKSKVKNFGYCDECPVQKLCPERYKQWSK